MEVLGIDIGGSGIKGAIVNTKKGTLVTERLRIPTPQPATPDAVLDTIVELVSSFKWKGVIGCGFPAVVQHEIVRTASNIDKSWIGRNASMEIKKITGCPTHLVNDVDEIWGGYEAKGSYHHAGSRNRNRVSHFY
jgi:polyphosphate glucokinase